MNSRTTLLELPIVFFLCVVTVCLFLFFFFCHTLWHMGFPDQGWNLQPLQWKLEVLTPQSHQLLTFCHFCFPCLALHTLPFQFLRWILCIMPTLQKGKTEITWVTWITLRAEITCPRKWWSWHLNSDLRCKLSPFFLLYDFLVFNTFGFFGIIHTCT